jgi:phage terminase large subunit-like protein
VTPRQREQALAAVAASPQAFRQALLIDADGQPKRLAEVIDPWQRADFEAVDPAWQAIAHGKPMPTRRRAWFERPRGHSKTGDIAAMVSFCLAGSPRQLLGVVAAADSEQAGLIRDAIGGLCSLNWWLNDALEVQRGRVVNRRTNSELRILSADAPSSYGLTPDFVVCDEVTHWTKRDLWDSLFSAAAKKGRCLLTVICNAGFESTWQWPLREAIRTDPNWHFAHLDGPQASWITEDRLAEQRRLLPPIAYRRLWMNEWSSGSGDALLEEDVRAACTLKGPAACLERGWATAMGVDLSVSQDSSVIAVVGKHVGYREAIPAPRRSLGLHELAMIDAGLIEEPLTDFSQSAETKEIAGSGALRLLALRIFRPPGGKTGKIDLTLVEQTMAELHAAFACGSVLMDAWSAEPIAQRLHKVGCPAEVTHCTAPVQQVMATCLLTAFAEQQLAIWEDPALLSDLRNARVVERQTGNIRIQSPKNAGGDATGHGDTVSALMLALVGIRRLSHPVSVVNGPLVCSR